RVASTSPTKTVWYAKAAGVETRTAAAISSARRDDFIEAPTEMASVDPSRRSRAPRGAESRIECMGKPESAEESGMAVRCGLLVIAALTQHRPARAYRDRNP